MYFIVCFLVFNNFDAIVSKSAKETVIDTFDVNYMSNVILKSLGINTDTTEDARINELKEKLRKINSFTIDKNKYETLLKNIMTQSKLNETNFFKALNEDEQFKFLLNNDTKSLYLKLKERMNRDDIMKILAEKSQNSHLMRSARKVMGQGAKRSNNNDLEVIVDKILGETPNDNHKYDAKDNESMYWDPQIELEELQNHHRHDGRRIFRGERTTIRYYPFMVSIHIMDRFWCGGVLYWHDLVLTSASCLQLMHNNRFFRENPKVLQVRVGSNHSRISGEVVDALEVYFHPGYNPRTLRNNIAVIRLRRHLYFNYHRIPKIISISHSSNSIAATAEVLLLGWGVTRSALSKMAVGLLQISQKMSYEPIYLQRKFLPVYPNSFCKEIYGDKFVSSTMFCAGTVTTGEGACDHDAGGPAILSGKLVGIISFGPAVCGYPNTPTVFTLVGAYADWIETINDTMPGYYQGVVRTTTTTRRPLLEFLETLYITTTDKYKDLVTLPSLRPDKSGTEKTNELPDLTTADDEFESE